MPEVAIVQTDVAPRRYTAPIALAAQAFADIVQEIEDNDNLPTPRPLDDLVKARFAMLAKQLGESVDDRIALKRAMDAFIADCKRREDRMRATRKKVEVYLDGFKAQVRDVMVEHHSQPYKGDLGEIKLQKNGGKPRLTLRFDEQDKQFSHCVDPQSVELFEVPAEFIEVVTITRINTDAVRQALGTGAEFPWAQLERGVHVRFGE